MLLFLVAASLLSVAGAVPTMVIGLTASVVPNERAFRVGWNMPNSINGTFIRYDVEWGIYNERWVAIVTVEGDATTTTAIVNDTSFARGTKYTFRVRAVSSAGEGPYNLLEDDNHILLPHLPTMVIGLTASVVPNQRAFRVDWNMPNSINGTFIRYDVEWGIYSVRWVAIVTVEGDATTTTAIVNDTSFARGTKYAFRVRAVSSAGEGPYNLLEDDIHILLPHLPSRVTGLTASVVQNDAAFRVDWIMPSDINRIFVRYDLQWGIHGKRWVAIVTVEGDATTTTAIVDDSRLTRGRQYVFRVRAVSTAGEGPYSEDNPKPYLPFLLTRVTGLTVSVVPNERAFRVDWNVPSIIYGTFIRYDVEWGIHNVKWVAIVTVEGLATTTTAIVNDTNLARGTEYVFRVRTVSTEGEAPYNARENNIILFLPYVPSVVTGVTALAVPNEAAFRVDWNMPSIIDGTFIRYDVQWGIQNVRWVATVTVEGDATTTTAIVDDSRLIRGIQYIISVRAISTAGEGPNPPKVLLPKPILPDLPPQVTGVTTSLVQGQAAVRVAWNKTSVEGNFVRYDVQYIIGSQSWNTVAVVNQNSMIVHLNNIEQGTTYYFRVRAVSNAGNGNYSVQASYTVPNETVPTLVPASPGNYYTAEISAGTFMAGLMAGILGILLVVAIVLGACKHTKETSKNKPQKASPKPADAVEITLSPACENTAKIYEEIDEDQIPNQRYLSSNEECAYNYVLEDSASVK